MQHELATPRRHAESGLTLAEMLVTLAVLGILAAVALPSLSDLLARRRLDGAATEYLNHLQWARQQAVQLNRKVRLKLGAGGPHSCYVFYTGAADNCQCNAQGARCTDPSQLLLAVALRPSDGVSLSTPSAGAGLLIDPLRGTVSPAMTTVFSAGQATVHQITNIMGRTRSCSPAPPVLGLPAC